MLRSTEPDPGHPRGSSAASCPPSSAASRSPDRKLLCLVEGGFCRPWVVASGRDHRDLQFGGPGGDAQVSWLSPMKRGESSATPPRAVLGTADLGPKGCRCLTPSSPGGPRWRDDAIGSTATPGLRGFRVLAVSEHAGELERAVETLEEVNGCPSCGVRAGLDDRGPARFGTCRQAVGG